MYFPYFRGKQNELITVRDNAGLLAHAGFTPIIEPVKESLVGLKRALGAVNDENGSAILIVNPRHGHHVENAVEIDSLFLNELKEQANISAGILLTDEVTVDEIASTCEKHASRVVTLIHAGFTEARTLAGKISQTKTPVQHIFLEEHCGKLYRKHFKNTTRILLRDGFKKQKKNSDYPTLESFSDLHATYTDEGMDGFGDFLIVGNDYSTSGGPAYAVAIHLTFIDPDKDDEMYIHHFISIRQDTPTDPAGKFAEALQKLVDDFQGGHTKILRTGAIEQFLDLHARGHFPGLGFVKKLSMQHHIETLAKYFEQQ